MVVLVHRYIRILRGGFGYGKRGGFLGVIGGIGRWGLYMNGDGDGVLVVVDVGLRAAILRILSLAFPIYLPC